MLLSDKLFIFSIGPFIRKKYNTFHLKWSSDTLKTTSNSMTTIHALKESIIFEL